MKISNVCTPVGAKGDKRGFWHFWHLPPVPFLKFVREETYGQHLTKVPFGPILIGMVRALREDRFSERKPIMKTLLRARLLAPNEHDQLLTPVARGHGTPKRGAEKEQHGNGGSVRSVYRTGMAQVHGGGCEQQARNGAAHVVLCDGSVGIGSIHDRARAQSDALSRRDYRSGQADRVILRVHTERNNQLLAAIARDALRAAATAPTVVDALDVAGDALRAISEMTRGEVRHG
ncbi:hypothetical protein OVY01_13540 [Robbsia sp. Bb-Pol-6]|uniref:Uncharacterized protein n=1 Tax=Robbsia betulipollinis TaxID=2981849 RepID=A0ABT3ZP48_9BURK|nr:hypothetical protein [Robbsia betulipollinis]MCY0388242.1 hypothetical protein [Robbsia betulipollinis]